MHLQEKNGAGTLIPNLQNHMNQFPIGSATHINDSLAIDNWTRMVDYNSSLKASSGDSLKNISFSAGPFYNYEEQFSRDSSATFTSYKMLDVEGSLNLGLMVNEAGMSVNFPFAYHSGFQQDSSVGNAITTTTGYTLGDDDAGDFFSVNVSKDAVFNTPVFRTVAGASSCPYEPGTMTRNLAVLTPKYLSAINVNPDSFAVFPVYLGNASGTDETGDYFLKVLNATNPDGAIISVNGIIIENGITYTLAPGQTQTYLTVRRGPFAYHYDGIKVMLGPACGDDQVSDTLTIGVDFLRPCSEIVITQPLSNWLVNTSNNNVMNISIAGFDSSAASGVQNIKLQYRAMLSGNDRPAGDTSGTGISKKYDLTSLKHIPFMSDKNRKLLKSLTDSYDAARDSRTNALAGYAKSTDGKYHDFKGMIPPWDKVNKPRVVPSSQKPFQASMLKADPESASASPVKVQSTGLMIEGTENS
ncbi:MAG: hypothetical protein HYV28_00940, partial [Ignavibacteriales bacterium]|nr:hypothetical protein [Ignavibacteriales bacterium]